MTGDIARLAEVFARARRPVVFTGAGVSTESGIPDFRSPGGVWDRYDPSELTYQNFVGSVAGRRKYWEVGRATYPVIRAAKPNPAHRALAELHRMGRLDCCITQNVDLVMSGSVSQLLRPKAGDTVRAAFTRLSSVSARFP